MSNPTARAYFLKRVDGKLVEIDHPANGLPMWGTGAMVIRDGVVLENSRKHIEVGLNSYANLKKVTADTFGFPVVVKLWHPERKPEWIVMVPAKQGDIEACDYPGSFSHLKREVVRL